MTGRFIIDVKDQWSGRLTVEIEVSAHVASPETRQALELDALASALGHHDAAAIIGAWVGLFRVVSIDRNLTNRAQALELAHLAGVPAFRH